MTDHAHHYVLPSEGLIIVGVCTRCGHKKEHVNTIPDTTMGGTATTAMNASRAAGVAKRNKAKAGRPIVLTPSRQHEGVA